MKIETASLLLVAIACASCTIGKGSDSIGREECKAVLARGYQLQGTPESDYTPLMESFGKVCEDKRAISRADYECGMKSNTLEQYQACHIVVDFR